MIKIQHRVNSINKLNNLNRNFGAEIDIRSFNKKLILNHEPFEKGELLNVYLKKFNHKFLILNIKEEGIENLTLDYLRKYKIKNYFLLDVTIPKIFQFVKNKKKSNLCLRISKFFLVSLLASASRIIRLSASSLRGPPSNITSTLSSSRRRWLPTT